MKIISLVRQKQKIEWLINQAKTFDGDQLELQSHWARYLCVLVAGFLENAISEVYSSYVQKCANAQVANYVTSVLNKIKNPKSQKFLETARSLNPDWELNLNNYIQQNGRKDAIDSVMTNRHLIAHGKDSGITLASIDQYFKKGVEVIDYIEWQCGIK
jgi:hypothetical protein